MFRYMCTNPDCLHTFTLPFLDIFRKCDLCGDILVHAGKKDGESYPPIEKIKDLEIKYAELRKKSMTIGLTESECRDIGRAIRKIELKRRKKILQEHGLWEDGVIYKHVMTDGLLKMVIDKDAMYYYRKKKERENGW